MRSRIAAGALLISAALFAATIVVAVSPRNVANPFAGGDLVLQAHTGAQVYSNSLIVEGADGDVVIPNGVTLRVDTITNSAGTGGPSITGRISGVTDITATGTIKADILRGDTITNEAGTSGPNFSNGLRTSKIGLGIAIPTLYAAHFSVPSTWNSGEYAFVFENNEITNSEGNTVKIIGGAGIYGQGSVYSTVLSVETNDGQQLFKVDGIGETTVRGSLTLTGGNSLTVGGTVTINGSSGGNTPHECGRITVSEGVGDDGDITVNCSTGYASGAIVMGGGCFTTLPNPIDSSYPSSDIAWRCIYSAAPAAEVKAYAVCCKY